MKNFDKLPVDPALMSASESMSILEKRHKVPAKKIPLRFYVLGALAGAMYGFLSMFLTGEFQCLLFDNSGWCTIFTVILNIPALPFILPFAWIGLMNLGTLYVIFTIVGDALFGMVVMYIFQHISGSLLRKTMLTVSFVLLSGVFGVYFLKLSS